MRRLLPTLSVWRGDGPASPLHLALQEGSALASLNFTDSNGAPHKFSELMSLTDADGLLVLHKGEIIYEQYAGVLSRQTPHALMSVTKSFVGTMAAMLVDDGSLNADELVTHYIPELVGTAYDRATIRELMDMTVAVRYSENYSDPSADIWGYLRAAGFMPRLNDSAEPGNLYDFIKMLKTDGEHGVTFSYKTVNAEVLAWVLKRTTGQSLAQLLSTKIWKPLGAEEDAYFDVDSQGTECGGGGLNATLRDLGRFGEAMRSDGRFNGRQVIPARVVADIRRGGDREKFAQAGATTLDGWSYRDMWWISNDQDGAFEARGIFGQALYVDPKAEVTIVRLASEPTASNVSNDWITLPAFRAVARMLMAEHDRGKADLIGRVRRAGQVAGGD
ncbi:serine hydrolase [Pseudomonas sp. PDM25]|uniref:serine hydrolase domain-containing protein n=1 Tax=Pseudomonas sp. PDM25 TaxID=2854772 RepID=UPI001C442C55|nr:serine hydrolase [Pseudomonas sp. PDM25]MBV7515675.1 beta-lactamase family protein [Pseudomonas sp. PDM25]